MREIPRGIGMSRAVQTASRRNRARDPGFNQGRCNTLLTFAGRIDDEASYLDQGKRVRKRQWHMRPRRRPQRGGREAQCGVRACRLAGLSLPLLILCAGPQLDHRRRRFARRRPCGHRGGDLAGNSRCRGLHRVTRKVCIALCRLRLGMPEHLADDRQPHPARRGNAGKAVT